MWIAIGAVALFILYFVIKKSINKANTDETTTPTQASASLEEKTSEKAPVVEAVTTEAKEEKTEPKKATAKKPAPKKAAAKKPAEKKEAAADTSEYATQYSVLSSSYKKAQEFTLFDSKAAFFSNEGDNTVTLLSITAFVKGAAKTASYNTYSFNVVDWTWDGEQPKGCAAEIKKHLSESFKKGETA